MQIKIDELKPQTGADGAVEYYTFWVRLKAPHPSEHWVSVSGWRYWPKGNKMSSPSIKKGTAKYFNTVKLASETYALIRDLVECEIFGEIQQTPEAA